MVKRVLAVLVLCAITLVSCKVICVPCEEEYVATGVPSKLTQLEFVPRSASPSVITGTVYYDSDDDNLYVYDGAWTDLTAAGAGTPGGSDTQVQYNNGGAFGGAAGITYDDLDGSAHFQNASDSTTGFQVMDADGGTPIVNVDTTNERVGIGTTGPGADLHIVDASDHADLYLDHTATDKASKIFFQENGSTHAYFEARGSTITAPDLMIFATNVANGEIQFRSGAGSDAVRIDSNGNVGHGTMGPTTRTTISGTLGIGNNPTAPSAGNNMIIWGHVTTTPTLGADTAAMFARDVGGTTELFTKDEAGNETQQTSHPAELNGRLGLKSCNYHTGECVVIDIEAMATDLQNGVTGGTYITRTHLSEDQIVSWYEIRRAEAERINAQRLAEAAAVLTPTLQAEAVEQYTVTETRPVSPTQYITMTTIIYELDSETGQAVAREVVTTEEVTETVEVGLAYRLKEGCQLVAETGKFLCPIGEANAVYESYVPEPMPEWMQGRITTIFLAPKDISGIPKPVGEYKKLVDIGNYSIWWARAEAETLKGLHETLWAMNPKETLGTLAAVKTLNESFYDGRVTKATGMTQEQFVARRGKLINYLKSLGKDTTLLAQATTEHQEVEGIVAALGYTMQQLWAVMR